MCRGESPHLVHAREPPDDEPLEVQLRRDAQEEVRLRPPPVSAAPAASPRAAAARGAGARGGSWRVPGG